MTGLTVTEEIFARLTLHELLLKVVMANQFMFDEAVSEDAKAELQQVAARTYGGVTSDLDEARRWQLMTKRVSALAQRFVEKLSQHEAEIRQPISWADSSCAEMPCSEDHRSDC